jgi:hypothetical protein
MGLKRKGHSGHIRLGRLAMTALRRATYARRCTNKRLYKIDHHYQKYSNIRTLPWHKRAFYCPAIHCESAAENPCKKRRFYHETDIIYDGFGRCSIRYFQERERSHVCQYRSALGSQSNRELVDVAAILSPVTRAKAGPTGLRTRCRCSKSVPSETKASASRVVNIAQMALG